MYEDYEDEIYEFPELEQHTPGPWKVNSDGMGTVMCWNGNGDLQPLAKVFFQNFETEEAYANARLIAAAPELARILQRLRGENFKNRA